MNSITGAVNSVQSCDQYTLRWLEILPRMYACILETEESIVPKLYKADDNFGVLSTLIKRSIILTRWHSRLYTGTMKVLCFNKNSNLYYNFCTIKQYCRISVNIGIRRRVRRQYPSQSQIFIYQKKANVFHYREGIKHEEELQFSYDHDH